jgi:hypothetical protein
MDAILYFDTEDSISPPEAGCDDIVLWLAQLLSRHGIRGSFHVIGDKARTLVQRGRHDVIAAVRRHDVSSHFNHGSVHPMTVERVSALDWHEGVRVAREMEEPGFAAIQSVLGRCAALTRHGSSYAPQIVRAAGLCGKLYHGVPFALPATSVFWFCGTLCTSQVGLLATEDGRPGIAKFEEDLFADPPAFEARLAQFLIALQSVAEHRRFLALFGCHPLRLCLTRFCDNYVAGVNARTLVPPPLRSTQERQVVREQFARFIAALASAPGVRFIGLDGVRQRYAHTPDVIPADHLIRYSRLALDSDEVPLDDCFSPAELLVGLARAVLSHATTGRIPATVPAPRVIGPESLPPSSLAVATGQWDRAAVCTLAQALCDSLPGTDMLPSALGLDGQPLAPASMLSLLAQAAEHVWMGRVNWTIQPSPRQQAPAIAQRAQQRARDLQSWRILHPDTRFDRIAEFTRCQTWSLKPASTRSEAVAV